MKKIIFAMITTSVIFTSGAVFDGLDNQDMTEPKSHFWEYNPMKYNTYTKGQCTYYVFDRVRQDGHKIGNEWHDAKYWAKYAKNDGYTVNEKPNKGSILQSSRGKHGHVAYVEEVNKDGSLKVTDMNYDKPYEITSRTINSLDVNSYQYIHPKNNNKA